MSARTPVGEHGEVRVGLGRSNESVVILVLAFLLVMVFAGGYGGWSSTQLSARVIGFGVAAAFMVPLVMMVARLPRLLRPRWVVLDAVGLRIEHGPEQVVVPWPEIVGFGLGYEVPPREPFTVPLSKDDVTDRAKDYLAGKVQEALQVSGERRIALEIYPWHPAAERRYRKLAPYWKRDVPPVAGLPDFLWRFPLPPVVSIGQAVEQGARVVAPQRWLGWFQRPWSEPAK